METLTGSCRVHDIFLVRLTLLNLNLDISKGPYVLTIVFQVGLSL